MDGGNEISSGPRLVEAGDWAGWRTWSGLDPFEDQSGPFYFREDESGRVTTGFRAETKHMNGGGFMHGGCMMTFADSAIFTIATDELAGSHGVTMHLAGDFLDPASVGQLIEARGEVVRAGGKTIYVVGMIRADGKPVLSFNGIIRKITRR